MTTKEKEEEEYQVDFQRLSIEYGFELGQQITDLKNRIEWLENKVNNLSPESTQE